MAITYVPLWRDQYQDLGVNPRNYLVKVDGTTVYSGRAYARPGELTPRVRINDIAAPHVGQNADCLKLMQGYYPADIIRTLAVYDANGVTQLGDNFLCYDKWEPDNVEVIGIDWAHDPISTRIARGMPIIWTLYNSRALAYDGGPETFIRRRYSSQGSYQDVLDYGGPGNYVITDTSLSPETFVLLNDHRFDFVNDFCGRYALYYVNGYGAWDILLIEGAAQEGRSYTRHEMRKLHNNAYQPRGIYNYANEVRRTWTMHTGWLSDAQAAKMHHLVGSTLVYIFDLVEMTFIPVNVTDSQVVARKYEQEGAPLYYAIHLEEGAEALRR